MLSKAELFARLAEGHAARVTVVTPNKRLSQALMGEFDSLQIEKGLKAWEAPDILPIGAFVERLWEDALYSPTGESQGSKLPLLLTPAQEQHLWEEIVRDSRPGREFLLKESAARQCREAWRLQHQWRIDAGAVTEDSLAFSQWVSVYKNRTRGDTDAARLPDLMAAHLGSLKTPQLVVAYAFDVMPPQTKEFLQNFALEECQPDAVAATHSRASYASAGLEIEAAAKWARARLEEGRKRIAVVVPDLQIRRSEVVRIFSRVMQPGYNLPGAAKAPMPFDVSLGMPLSHFPLVDAALTLLELCFRPIAFDRASHLMRSPFLGGADSEMARRATLDARLRKEADATIPLPKLIAGAEPAPRLRALLEKVLLMKELESPESPAQWARCFSELLEAAGFPGERALDSEEFQTRAKWHEVLGELAKLERIAQHLSFEQAFGFLQRQCASTLFQAESPDAPIQVLGVLESAGLRFDCLWVSGLTDEAWPLAARPNPFIPIAAQKAAGIPQASAEASAALDERLTGDWKRAAAEVVFSWPSKDKDKDLAPSPLIVDIPEQQPAIPDYPRYRDLLFLSRKIESFEDNKGPPVTPGKVHGGTRVLSDQAACPFRAFARFRLRADELEEPASGLDPRDRGKLLHALMKEVWSRVKAQSNLARDLTTIIGQSADAAIAEMKLEGRFAELERERLQKLAREWLEIEQRREPFEIAFLEEERKIKIGTLEFQSRIDRMDKLKDGGHVLIDYKSSRFLSVRFWEGPRPEDPQLPLYAITAPEELAAVAFAQIRAGEMRFVGFSDGEGRLPNVKAAESWPKLLAGWKRDAEALARAFAEGDAAVDPKEGLKTCRYCEMQTLCRVYEKLSPGGEG